MRRVLTLVGLAAILGASQVGSAGATIGHPQVPDGATVEAGTDAVVNANVECKTVFVNADVGADAKAEKKITLRGYTLGGKLIDQTVFRVVKTVALTVCLKATPGVVLNVGASVLDAKCPEGQDGLKLIVTATNQADVTGSIDGTIRLAVSDQDNVADLHEGQVNLEEVFEVEASEKLDEHVTDAYEIEDLVLCVGAGVN